jgi:hypothetical protein
MEEETLQWFVTLPPAKRQCIRDQYMKSGALSILSLPQELLEEILFALRHDLVARSRLSRTCKKMRTFLTDDLPVIKKGMDVDTSMRIYLYRIASHDYYNGNSSVLLPTASRKQTNSKSWRVISTLPSADICHRFPQYRNGYYFPPCFHSFLNTFGCFCTSLGHVVDVFSLIMRTSSGVPVGTVDLPHAERIRGRHGVYLSYKDCDKRYMGDREEMEKLSSLFDDESKKRPLKERFFHLTTRISPFQTLVNELVIYLNTIPLNDPTDTLRAMIEVRSMIEARIRPLPEYKSEKK